MGPPWAAPRFAFSLVLGADEDGRAAHDQAQSQEKKSAEPVGGALELLDVCERHSPFLSIFLI